MSFGIYPFFGAPQRSRPIISCTYPVMTNGSLSKSMSNPTIIPKFEICQRASKNPGVSPISQSGDGKKWMIELSSGLQRSIGGGGEIGGENGGEPGGRPMNVIGMLSAPMKINSFDFVSGYCESGCAPVSVTGVTVALSRVRPTLNVICNRENSFVSA